MNLSVILFLFLHFVNESLGKRKYCDYTKNVYYSEATGGCKKCDPCFKGWGLVSEIDFEIDSTRGALGCRKCRQCKDGTFQKRYKAFRSCKLCKVCKQGQVEVQQCTNQQNRKCKKDKKDEVMYTPTSFQSGVPRDVVPTDIINPVAKPLEASPAPNTKDTTSVIVIHKDFQHNKVYFILSAVFVMAAFTVIVVVLFGRYLGNRHKQRQKLQAIEQREQQDEDNQELSNEANAETISTVIDETIPKTVQKRDEHTMDQNTINEKIPHGTLGNSQNKPSIPICKNIRLDDKKENSESSLPLLSSEFEYSLQTFQNISSLNQDKNEAVSCRNCSEHAIDKLDNTQSKSTGACFHGNVPTVVTENYSDDISNDGNSLQRKEMFEVMTPLELQNMAHHIAANSCYEKVGRVLGLSDNDIDIAKSNYTDVEDIAYNVLKKWTQKKSSSATKLTLQKALRHLGRDDIADLL